MLLAKPRKPDADAWRIRSHAPGLARGARYEVGAIEQPKAIHAPRGAHQSGWKKGTIDLRWAFPENAGLHELEMRSV
jgi:hypothetical protein